MFAPRRWLVFSTLGLVSAHGDDRKPGLGFVVHARRRARHVSPPLSGTTTPVMAVGASFSALKWFRWCSMKPGRTGVSRTVRPDGESEMAADVLHRRGFLNMLCRRLRLQSADFASYRAGQHHAGVRLLRFGRLLALGFTLMALRYVRPELVSAAAGKSDFIANAGLVLMIATIYYRSVCSVPCQCQRVVCACGLLQHPCSKPCAGCALATWSSSSGRYRSRGRWSTACCAEKNVTFRCRRKRPCSQRSETDVKRTAAAAV